MPKFSIKNVCLKGISSAVPKHTEENKNLNYYTKEELKKLIDTIGIEKRRIAKEHLSTSDLFLAAAKSLIDTLGWSRDDIEIIVCVTQTPDYVLPGTSSIIHHKLGLSKSCFVLDINQGCAGYVYGMSVISSLISSAKFKKGLLLVGDTITKNISKYDKSLMPLFSDAATATAFEYNELASEIFFNTDIDSENFDGIIIPAGGSKKPYSENVDKYIETDGNIRKETHLVMKGLHVFNFSLQKVVPNVEQLLLFAQVEKSKIDNYIFHQANLLILKSLCKKLGISFDKTSSSLINYGNTSSASIPLTIVTSLSKNNLISNQKLLLSGFGVGLSVGSAIIDFENVVCNEIIEVE